MRRLTRLLTTGALCLALAVPQPAAAATESRVTYYLPTGNATYSGVWPYEGVAAANLAWLPIGTRFTLDCLPGNVYTVLDTGHLPARWVDIYVETPETGRWIARVCGDYSTVREVR